MEEKGSNVGEWNTKGWIIKFEMKMDEIERIKMEVWIGRDVNVKDELNNTQLFHMK